MAEGTNLKSDGLRSRSNAFPENDNPQEDNDQNIDQTEAA